MEEFSRTIQTKSKETTNSDIMDGTLVFSILVLLGLLGVAVVQSSDEIVSTDEDEKETGNPVKDYLDNLQKICSENTDIEIEDINNEAAEESLKKAMCKKTRQGFGACPSNFVSVNGNCYHFSVTRANWHLARLSCRSMGGDLVTLDDYDEYEDIQRTLRYYFTVRANWWTGASELAEPNLWTWTNNGNYVPVGMWCPDEPPTRSGDDQVGECMLMTTSDCGRAAPCNESTFRNKQIHFICELESNCEQTSTVVFASGK